MFSKYRHQMKLFYIVNIIVFMLNSLQYTGASPYHKRTYIENDILKVKYERLASLVDASLESGFYEAFEDEISQKERSGEASSSSSCMDVRQVPSDVGIDGNYHFYKKYTEAYGIPILGTEFVSDKALQRACYGVRFLFADNRETRHAFYKAYGRVVVLATGSKLTSLPEYAPLLPKNYNGLKAIGGVSEVPVVVVSEDQLDCHSTEDILVRELAIGILNIAFPRMERGRLFTKRLRLQYEWSTGSGRWRSTSASLCPQTYLAEGVQSFLNVNKYADPADGLHNNIAWRQSLQAYDPRLFNLILEMLPCANSYRHNCKGTEDSQHLRMNCPLQMWPE